MNLLAGSRATDLGPFRAITAGALRQLDMRDRNYGWTVEMQVKAARQGLRVVEVPVDYRPRIGRSKVSGTVRGTVGAGTKIIATILRHARAPVIPCPDPRGTRVALSNDLSCQAPPRDAKGSSSAPREGLGEGLFLAGTPEGRAPRNPQPLRAPRRPTRMELLGVTRSLSPATGDSRCPLAMTRPC
jgi:hypothetical protein